MFICIVLFLKLILMHLPCSGQHAEKNTPGSGEQLLPLPFRPMETTTNYSSTVKSIQQYLFILDTLDIPLVDDFSADRFKNYDPGTYPPSSLLVVNYYWFLIDFSPVPVLSYSVDSTYEYNYDATGTFIDSVLLTPYTVIFYDDTLKPFTPTGTGYYFPAYSVFDTAGTPPDTVAIASPQSLTNKFETFTMALDDSRSIWIDRFVFRNNSLATDPPTIGVATFDGLDEDGHAYDMSDPFTYGIADYMTTKPIDLFYTVADSVYFSFYYQPQGIGNDPQPEDSLILEFFSPLTNTWYRKWAMTGDSVYNFKQVMISIGKYPMDTLFLRKGFSFRFKNYATLSGDFDHWHIDYIRLAANRTFSDTLFNDVAFIYDNSSLINTYSSMPWKHFLSDPVTFMSDTIKLKIRNLDTVSRTIFPISFISNPDSTFTIPTASYSIFPSSDSLIPRPLAYVCNFSDDDSAAFLVTKLINPQAFDPNPWNDTLRYTQKFYNYYSYDDGTAEAAYGVNNFFGATIACKYEVTIPDTLRGMQIAFIPALEDVSNMKFILTVWGGSSVPQNIIYQNTSLDKPQFPDGYNAFYTYLLDSPIVLSGTIYIGFEQLTTQIITLGYDMNKNSNNVTYYNDGTGWANSILGGTPMMRPVFGDYTPEGAGITEKKMLRTNALLYPNPVKDLFTVKIFNGVDGKRYNLAIFNVNGKENGNYFFNSDGVLPVSTTGFSSGIYFYRITCEDAAPGTKIIQSGKFIIE